MSDGTTILILILAVKVLPAILVYIIQGQQPTRRRRR